MRTLILILAGLVAGVCGVFVGFGRVVAGYWPWQEAP